MNQWKRATSLFCLTASAACAEQFTGWISDQKCASTSNFAGPAHEQCVKSGQPVVFVNEAGNQVLRISNPEKAAAMIGQKVTIDGARNGDSIQIVSVAKAPPG
ncbi:MAG: hypothetical protein JNK48_15795 [Bryobacterales bacterium]|nr:hypothetical protein [Bryobacterales bacterium]